MVEVIWTQNATDEIVRIAEYLERYSEYYASMIVKRLYEKVAVLKQFPILGRVISEMQEDQYRELIEGNYRIMYEILDEEIILIQRVPHSSRFFDKLL
jgi:plasmid stabilization system protein ParE